MSKSDEIIRLKCGKCLKGHVEQEHNLASKTGSAMVCNVCGVRYFPDEFKTEYNQKIKSFTVVAVDETEKADQNTKLTKTAKQLIKDHQLVGEKLSETVIRVFNAYLQTTVFFNNNPDIFAAYIEFKLDHETVDIRARKGEK
jgi:hypothetical protein